MGSLVSLPVLLTAVVACAASAPPPSPGRDERLPAGLAVLPSGRAFVLELALTPEEQARGYMGRAEISREEGMLFPSERPAIRKFWMKNCLVPIDMVWLDRDHHVVAIEHAAPPCRKTPCPSYGPDVAAWSVLEVRGGELEKEGVTVGDTIAITVDR